MPLPIRIICLYLFSILQEVLKDLIAETMPVLNAHFKYHGVDISTVTFNWLITLYLDAVPFEVIELILEIMLIECPCKNQAEPGKRR